MQIDLIFIQGRRPHMGYRPLSYPPHPPGIPPCLGENLSFVKGVQTRLKNFTKKSCEIRQSGFVFENFAKKLEEIRNLQKLPATSVGKDLVIWYHWFLNIVLPIFKF